MLSIKLNKSKEREKDLRDLKKRLDDIEKRLNALEKTKEGVVIKNAV